MRGSAVLPLALLLAACSAPTTATGTAPTNLAATAAPTVPTAKPDLCGVVNDAQVTQVIGHHVGPGRPATAPGVGCGWIADATGDNSTAGVLYADQVSYEAAKKLSGQQGMTMTRVPGLGDEAYAQSLGSGAPLLFLKKGSHLVTVSVDIQNATPDTDLTAEKQLATLVAPAL
jgi:hypothetical protein